MAAPPHHVAHHAHHGSVVRIKGLPISAHSSHLLKELATEARLPELHITSVHRSVPDQARIFFDKHVVERKTAKYKNPEVAKIVAHARALQEQGRSRDHVQAYLITAIEHIHGGPTSVSAHLGTHVFTEVFDVAHYSGPTAGPTRRNHMTNEQAKAFLAACRRRIPLKISRLGHSAELGFALARELEFADEKCFHFEVKQLLYDRLEVPSSTRIV